MYATMTGQPRTRALRRLASVISPAALLAGAILSTGSAATIRVPEEQGTIQAGIDAAGAGDTVLVSPGAYKERIRLKEGVTLRSAGDDAKGELGLKRAEATIIDGGGQAGAEPGVAMAEGSTLDGFTVTRVGLYDDALWKKHHATQGEEQDHDDIGRPGTPGIGVIGVACSIRNNIIHHNGSTGIAIAGVEGRRCSPHVHRNFSYRNMGGGIGSTEGSTAAIEENVCFQNFYAGIGHSGASPTVTGNVCYENIRAGIGISEGARPIVRGNRCFKNRRAGIGIRTGKETAPLVEGNECHENDMAGIGCRSEATPVIRNNRCWGNAMAGIGSESGARPVIIGNECYENNMAGIGVRMGAKAVIVDNRCRGNKQAGIGVREKGEAIILDSECIENGMVAIGVREGARAHIARNLLERTGGMPPMIAVRENSSAVVAENIIRGGGVAGVMVEGKAMILGNQLHGSGPSRGPGPPSFGAWIHAGSEVIFSDNRVDGWRHALFASGAKRVAAIGNTVSRFLDAAIAVRDSNSPAHLFGNVALSDIDRDSAVSVSGPQGIVAENRRVPPPEESAPAAPEREARE